MTDGVPHVLLVGSGDDDAPFVVACWLEFYARAQCTWRCAELHASPPSETTCGILVELGADAQPTTPESFAENMLPEADLVIALDPHAADAVARTNLPCECRCWESVGTASAASFVTLRQRCLDLVRELAMRPGARGIERLQGSEHFEVLSTETAYRGFATLDIVHLRHRLYTGGWSVALRREVVRRGPAVAVLMYDPGADCLVLIEQFRIAAAEDANGPWQLEMVAGIIDPGESPEDVARREALEEAGCEVTDLEPVCRYMASVGISTESMHVYAGRVNSEDAGGVHGLAAEGEDIRVCRIGSAEAAEMLAGGRISNAATIIALQWFQQHRDELRARWLDRE